MDSPAHEFPILNLADITLSNRRVHAITAPPSMLIRFSSMPNSRMQAMDCAAKASFSSMMSISARVSPARCKALRVAVTGRSVGLPLFESLEVLGRDESLRRMQVAAARLGAA